MSETLLDRYVLSRARKILLHMNNHKIPAPAALLPAGRREPERSESDRRATGSKAGPDPNTHPDPEVVAQAKRRRFTAEYKHRIVSEAEQAKGSSSMGSFAAPRRIVLLDPNGVAARARLRGPPGQIGRASCRA